MSSGTEVRRIREHGVMRAAVTSPPWTARSIASIKDCVHGLESKAQFSAISLDRLPLEPWSISPVVLEISCYLLRWVSDHIARTCNAANVSRWPEVKVYLRKK